MKILIKILYLRSTFQLINEFIDLLPGQEFHMEPGSSIIGQCGSLISKVLYIKNGSNTLFAIIDAGMTDLIQTSTLPGTS